MKILWTCPNLNHYKYKFLNYLNTSQDVEITILAGSGRENSGDPIFERNLPVKLIQMNVSKREFGFSKEIRKKLKKIIHLYDYVMIPRERKNILLIVYAYLLTKKISTKLFSYNHPISYSRVKFSYLDLLITKFLHSFYDKIIFYTKKSLEKAIKLNLISSKKAHYANNTIYTKDIEEKYKFIIPSNNDISLLFIGRLIENKKLDRLFEYYFELKNGLKIFRKLLISTSLVMDR